MARVYFRILPQLAAGLAVVENPDPEPVPPVGLGNAFNELRPELDRPQPATLPGWSFPDAATVLRKPGAAAAAAG